MLRIHLFSTLRLFYQDRPLKFSALPKTLPLWSYLLLNREKALPRPLLAYTLWPDVNEAEARSNLRRHLYELRRILPPAPAACPWLLVDNSTVQWNPAAPYWLDIAEFIRLQTAQEQPTALAQAVQIYSGDLLPEVDEDWLFLERERLRNLFFANLTGLIAHHRTQQDYPQAIAYAQQLLQHDPLREDIVRELMSLRHTLGDRAGALQEYRTFEQRLRVELDAPPMPETSAFYNAIAHQPSPPATPITAPAATPTAPRTTLPAQLTTFIGREEEVTELCRLLTRAEAPVRLLTLTAAGGSGKTRLAIQLGNAVAPAYRDGVWWVDLASVVDERLTAQAVTKALGLTVAPQQGFVTALVEHLQSKEALLLLDNCEHLIDECAMLAQRLLSHCPQVQILATSREAFKIPGETTWLVPLLSVPRRGTAPPCADLLNYQAIRLFLERARALLPNFQLTPQNASAVTQICQRLDGMPLALELAAARVKVLSVEQIAARLDDRFRLLKADSRTLLPRYQTLRATIDWSYELLAPAECSLLQRLAIFAGGCTLEAVEAVVADATALADETPLDLLTRLVEKSLVIVQQQETTPTRYTLLESIREYALEKLRQADNEMDARRRHRDWFLQRADQIAAGMSGPQQTLWLAEMDAEYENFQAAIEWSRQTAGEAPLGLRLACHLRHIWDRHGDLQEGSRCLQQLLAHPENSTPTPARAMALNHLGFLTFLEGDPPTAVTRYQEALAIGQTLQDLAVIAQSCASLALVLTGMPQPEQAQPYIEQGLAAARALADRKQIYAILFYDAWLAMVQGNHQRAHDLLEESTSLMRAEGDLVRLGPALWLLGHLYWHERDYAHALAAFRESLILRRDLKSRRGIAYAIDGIAWVAAVTGQAAVAARLFGAADAHFTAMNTHFHPVEQPTHDAAVAAARAALGAECFAAEWEAGATLMLEAATELALQVTAPAPAASASRPAQVPAPAQTNDALVKLYALGPMRVCRDGQMLTAADWGYVKAKELLFYLLTYGPATREQIGLVFWPDAAPDQLRRNLGVTLHHLRKALGGNAWVRFEDEQYSFNRALPYWYDVEAFTTLCHQAQTATPAAPLLQQATALYGGAFLADIVHGEWCFALRERLSQQQEQALLALGEAYVTTDDYPHAVEIYRRAIVHDPYLEAAYRELMRALVASGERGQALRVYTDLTKLMQKEFNAPPSRETQAIYELLRRG